MDINEPCSKSKHKINLERQSANLAVNALLKK
jgi:hypothetical protein